MIINKKRFFKYWPVLLGTAALFHFSTASLAAAREGNKHSRGNIGLEAITVTAQKQEENVQEVPLSITVFNDRTIEDMRIESIKDVADFTPNLMLFDNGQPGQNSPTMRGINATVDSFTVSTGLYVNGVPVLMGSGFDTEMYDIERIEVLRGGV